MAPQHELAKAAFGRALNRWRLLPGFNQRRLVAMEGAEAKELIEEAHATVVEALLWARAFSDAARGCDGIDPITNYPADIEGLPAKMKAARYVANKGVHLLIELADVSHAPTVAPRGMRPHAGIVVAPILQWVDESRVPQPKQGKKGGTDSKDVDLRDAFVNRWCGQLVGPGLDEVEAYLARW